eukprot:TRINITY_DN8178_c0_g1_i2.p1 TRINITY_DN8178_c0_g1~~TRINITY_DN8178_c0_g1_i2.p1  ORF type:complete len:172 (+),score=55.41 TRINITY_DN8178_c0_g1_i2:129-644(+)
MTQSGQSTCTNFSQIFSHLIGEGNSIGNILKFLHQGVLAPSAMRLKFFILSRSNLQYFDCRNQWETIISFNRGGGGGGGGAGSGGDDDDGDLVQIVHQKWEETKPIKFEFCWNLIISTNSRVSKILDVVMKIVHIRWIVDVPNEERDYILKIFSEFYDPTGDFYSAPSEKQ